MTIDLWLARRASAPPDDVVVKAKTWARALLPQKREKDDDMRSASRALPRPPVSRQGRQWWMQMRESREMLYIHTYIARLLYGIRGGGRCKKQVEEELAGGSAKWTCHYCMKGYNRHQVQVRRALLPYPIQSADRACNAFLEKAAGGGR